MEKTKHSICKICNAEFGSIKEVNLHLKAHHILIKDYYPKYWPKNDLLTGAPIEFKNVDDYLEKDFSSRESFAKWCRQKPKEEVQPYVLDLFVQRAASKNTNTIPSQVELKSLFLPSWFGLKGIFGSEKKVIEALKTRNLTPQYDYLTPPKFSKLYPEILIDTREQNPLTFYDSKKVKLSCGDYSTLGELYCDVFVERKSLADLAGTLSQGKARFSKEVQRATDLGYYLIVVVEETLQNTLDYSPETSFGKINGKYLLHKVRELNREFPNLQFVFSGSRPGSERIICKIFQLKGQVKFLDLEYLNDFGLI